MGLERKILINTIFGYVRALCKALLWLLIFDQIRINIAIIFLSNFWSSSIGTKYNFCFDMTQWVKRLSVISICSPTTFMRYWQIGFDYEIISIVKIFKSDAWQCFTTINLNFTPISYQVWGYFTPESNEQAKIGW